MPTPRDAFALSYGLNMAGNYFEGASMLAHFGATEADLKAMCEEQLRALAAQGAPTRYHVRQVKKSLEAAGLTAPNAPVTPDDYDGWVEAVSSAYYEALDEAGHGVYLAGWYLGSWVEYANLGVIVLMLRSEVPGNAALKGQLDEIQARLRETQAELPGALAVLPAEMADAVAKIVEVTGGVPPLDDPEQEDLDVADDLQEALYELGEAVDAILTKLG